MPSSCTALWIVGTWTLGTSISVVDIRFSFSRREEQPPGARGGRKLRRAAGLQALHPGSSRDTTISVRDRNSTPMHLIRQDEYVTRGRARDPDPTDPAATGRARRRKGVSGAGIFTQDTDCTPG